MENKESMSNAATYCASGEPKNLQAVIQIDGEQVNKIVQDFNGYYSYNLCFREILIGMKVCHPNLLSLEDFTINYDRNEDNTENKNKIKFVQIRYMNKGETLNNFIFENHSFFFPKLVKVIMYQIFKGLAYLHKSKIIHRDLHPGNILINNKLQLNIIDFGLGRPFKDGKELSSRSKRYFRSPEFHNDVFFINQIPDCHVEDGRKYNEMIDIFSAGLIFFKSVTNSILYRESRPFKTLIVAMMRSYVVTESQKPMNFEEMVQNFERFDVVDRIKGDLLGEDGKDLMKKCLLVDPKRRISALEALKHPYFNEFNKDVEAEVEKYKEMDIMDYDRDGYKTPETVIRCMEDLKNELNRQKGPRKRHQKEKRDLDSLKRSQQTDLEKEIEITEKIQRIQGEAKFRRDLIKAKNLKRLQPVTDHSRTVKRQKN